MGRRSGRFGVVPLAGVQAARCGGGRGDRSDKVKVGVGWDRYDRPDDGLTWWRAGGGRTGWCRYRKGVSEGGKATSDSGTSAEALAWLAAARHSSVARLGPEEDRERERVTGGAAGSVPTSKVRERKTLAGLLRAYRPTRKRKRKECWRGCRERTGQQNKGERRCWRGCGELTGQQREKEMLAGLRRAYRPAEKE